MNFKRKSANNHAPMTLTSLWAQTQRPILLISPISTGKRTALLNSITEGEGIEDPTHNSDITILAGKEPIEEIRERVQAISSHRPYSLKHTYLVCENLHGLPKPSADILLKLLEKPPSHLKIGLTATTLVGVQRTILSRAPCHTSHRWGNTKTEAADRANQNLRSRP